MVDNFYMLYINADYNLLIVATPDKCYILATPDTQAHTHWAIHIQADRIFYGSPIVNVMRHFNIHV